MPYLDLDGKLGNIRNVGEGNLFIPIMQDPRTLYFVNLRSRIDGTGDYEGSLGGGARRMLENGWNIGAYAFLDHRRTEYGSTWNQSTFGLEALGRNFDWRSNVYTPLGKRTKGTSNVDSAEWTASGIVITNTAQEEHALPGMDLEAGWRLPIYDAEDARQLRLYLGGYRFAGDGIQVQGGRIRAEYLLADFSDVWKGAQLTFNAEYQRDNARGYQSFAGVRLRIPLGKESGASHRLNAQERRMVAPIVRDVDIVSQMRNRVASQDLAVATASGQTLVAKSSQYSTGADVQSAVTAAGANSTVVLNGSFVTTSTIQLQAGQTLMGAGNLAVRTASGRMVTIAAPGATVNATLATGSAITTASNSTVTGMTVNMTNAAAGGTRSGIVVNNVANVTVSNNTINLTDTLGAAGIFGVQVLNAGASANVINNNITATGTTIVGAVSVANASAFIKGNVLAATGSNPGNSRAVSLNLATITAGSTGNTINAGSCIRVAGPGTGNPISFTNAADCAP